jgi:RhtB (resistance to homoserine/threonine) family protein
MDAFLTQWLLLVAVCAMATISPGPDLIMAIKNSLAFGRRAGIMTALGFGAGAMVHVTYTLAGLAAIIASSVMLFTILKIVGAAYLFYVGIQALRSRGWHVPDHLDQVTKAVKSDRSALIDGFWTNVLNPKATLFFLAVFTQILTPSMSLGQQAILGLTSVVIIIGWFTMVAVFMTTPSVRTIFARLSQTIDRLCGVLFIALGIKLLLTKLQTP